MSLVSGARGSKFRVLLLTNRDSDNVGDQVIEATVISLIKAAFANLDVAADQFEISSRAAGIITRAYMRTQDPALLASARKAISAADLLVFGGAPLFNYTYQKFYLRTIKTLELAHEYNVPVLFSSIGVEPYNADNPKSVALKEALALPVVRQITTRDDYESLEHYVAGTDVRIAHVSDPAVFADVVFGDDRSAPAAGGTESRKTVGLVPTRAAIFKDNGIDFAEDAQLTFWLDLIALLTQRGYDYRLFTTGHFTDEEFLEKLVAAGGLPPHKAALRVNSPEELVSELVACDAVVAYRLHASITSYAYGIPSIGLSWNFKVPYFYESVGYGERALDASRWTASDVLPALEKALAEGVTKDQEFLVSVYQTLFAGIKRIVAPGSPHEPYSYVELRANLPAYGGTSKADYREKLGNKSRRADEFYNRGSASAKQPTVAGRIYRRAKRALRRIG